MSTTSVVTDRAEIAHVISATLDELDELRGQHQHALQESVNSQTGVDEAEGTYLSQIAAALATGWFTLEGLAAQGHTVPKRLPKPPAGDEQAAVDRDQIPALITTTLGDLDHARQQRDAERSRQTAQQDQADAIAAAYSQRITTALSTGWFTIEGLAGQGHVNPKKGKGGRRPRAAAAESPGEQDGQVEADDHPAATQ